MIYVPSTVLPPKLRPNIFSGILEKKTARDLLQSSNFSRKLFGFLPDLTGVSGNEWNLFRTINIIERLNREFRRRNGPMEIVVEVNACYSLLALISLKIELYCEAYPLGKYEVNCFYSIISIESNFTQKSLDYLNFT